MLCIYIETWFRTLMNKPGQLNHNVVIITATNLYGYNEGLLQEFLFVAKFLFLVKPVLLFARILYWLQLRTNDYIILNY